MDAGRRVVLFAAVLASGVAGLSCSLDFDRYEAIADGEADGPRGRGDAGTPDTGGDASPVFDAPPRESSGPCTPPASCFTQASSCAATCTQQYQACTASCHNPGCMQNCTAQKQSCGGKCSTTCIDCTQSAGCPATSECLSAGSPP